MHAFRKYVLLGLPLLGAFFPNCVAEAASGSQSSSSGIINIVLLLLGVLVLVVAAVFLAARKKPDPKQTEPGAITNGFRDIMEGGQPSPQNLKQLLAGLRAQDPNFSENLFIGRVNNIFIQLEEAWQEKDWKIVRPFESNDIFKTHAKQLQEYIVSQTTNVINGITILKTEIADYVEIGPIDNLVVNLQAHLKDYILDDNTGQVVQGDPQRQISREYRLVLSRRKGVATKPIQNTAVSTCSNCGANVSINFSGECQYCGSMVGRGDFDWVLTSMDVISEM